MANQTFNINVSKITKGMIEAVSKFVVNKAKTNMDEISKGMIYTIRGRRHIASRRKDPPNNLTGELRKSIRAKIVSVDKAIVGSGNPKANYAHHLENPHGRLQRFNLQNLVPKNREKIDRVAAEVIKDTIR